MPTVGEAFDFLTENAHDMFGDVPSMLYVGHRSDTHPWWRQDLTRELGNPRLEIIDIQAGNLQESRESVPECAAFHHGDIRNPDAVPDRYGLVFWDEGPEHVSREDALTTLKMLMERHVHVLVSCPWGYQRQGSGPEDPEFHHWAPMPADFEEIGMQVRVFGKMFPDGHGNLIAWF